jgi:hypothetical protein
MNAAKLEEQLVDARCRIRDLEQDNNRLSMEIDGLKERLDDLESRIDER